jgi:carboxyl-terminal processing protease
MQVLSKISSSYVDSVDTDKLEQEAIEHILSQLDPHSKFIKKEDAERQQERLNGVYVGIGIFYNLIDDTLTILKPISNGPADRAGLKIGDRILEINNKSLLGENASLTIARDEIIGEPGTFIEMKIGRKGIKRPIKFIIMRDKLNDPSVECAYNVAPETAFIRINRYASNTDDEFKLALQTLQAEGANKLIIDLRDNGGGYLNAAVQMADHFLKEGQTIVYTQGHFRDTRTYKATADSLFKGGKIVVLINESTASASEIFAGAIQDWDRGLIIGRRSFGKGLVQNTYSLYRGDVLRLTIAKYFTPAGRLIQKSYENGFDAYSHDLIDRFNNGELVSADSIHFPDSLRFQTILSKRTVYAGGGIMPDIFVPLDTLSYPKYYRNLFQNGTLSQELNRYYIDNYQQIQRDYPNFDAFSQQFTVPKDLILQLQAVSKQTDLSASPKQQSTVCLHIKASLARELWSMSEFFKILNQQDECVLSAIDVLQNNLLYKKKLMAEKE